MATAAGRLPDDSNVWIWGVFEKFVIPTGAVPGTVDIFFRILRWSFQSLYEGRWPRADWREVPTLHLFSIQAQDIRMCEIRPISVHVCL